MEKVFPRGSEEEGLGLLQKVVDEDSSHRIQYASQEVQLMAEKSPRVTRLENQVAVDQGLKEKRLGGGVEATWVGKNKSWVSVVTEKVGMQKYDVVVEEVEGVDTIQVPDSVLLQRLPCWFDSHDGKQNLDIRR